MLRKKYKFIVGLHTQSAEMLRFAVAALGQRHKNILLIIHNGNPDVIVSERVVRRAGYRGALRIINSAQAQSELYGRAEIINMARHLKNAPEWILFMRDNDILADIDIPALPESNFAVMTNTIEIRGGLENLVRAMGGAQEWASDNENILLHRPDADATGIIMRTKSIIAAGDLINDAITLMRGVRTETARQIPDCGLIFQAVQNTARATRPDAAPIYMNNIGIIEINPDFGCKKPHVRCTPAVRHECDVALRAAIESRCAKKSD